MNNHRDVFVVETFSGFVSPGSGSQSSLPPLVRAFLILVAIAAVMSTTACTKKVPVPSLAQMDLDQAKALLSAAKLKPGNVLSTQGPVIPGAYVVSQNPAAGLQVKVDTPIDLTVELPIALPNLVDSGLTEAVNTLQSMGLKVMLVKQPTMNIFGKTKVVLQNPPATSMVRKDAAVMLTVSAPPDVKTILGAVEKDPAYQKLNPEYRSILDTFLK
jgi:beta-lactam-binding protein with PASTA domain